MQMKFSLLTTFGFLLIIAPIAGNEKAYAFNLNKMLEKVAPPQPSNQNQSPQKAKPGGLFGGSKPGGLFGSGGKSGGILGNTGSSGSSSKGSDPYQGSFTLRLACERMKEPSALYAGVSKGSLDNWSNAVAQDFGKAPDKAGRSNVLAVLNPASPKFNGLKWAENPGFYVGSFRSKKVKKEMERWGMKADERLEIAAKLRKAAGDSDLEDEDRGDAKFAYSLILAHFDGDHKNGSLTENYLKSAWENESIGAMYVRGKRMYKGLSYAKNVNGAKNYVYQAYAKINDIREEAEENQMPVPDLWDEPEKLWTVFATDPEFKDHKRFLSLKAHGDKIRADLQKQIDQGAGGGKLEREINRLAKIRSGAEKTIAKAFGIAKELAEMNKGLEDLQNIADPSAQVVAKKVAMEDRASKAIAEAIGKQTKDLSPAGMKEAIKAQQAARFVATESVQLVFGTYMSNAGSGGIGGMVATVRAAEHTRSMACRLNTAIDDYKAKKSITLEAPPVKADDEVLDAMLKEEDAD